MVPYRIQVNENADGFDVLRLLQKHGTWEKITFLRKERGWTLELAQDAAEEFLNRK